MWNLIPNNGMNRRSPVRKNLNMATVPQEPVPVFGPPKFLFYINGLPDNIKIIVCNDANLYSNVKGHLTLLDDLEEIEK